MTTPSGVFPRAPDVPPQYSVFRTVAARGARAYVGAMTRQTTPARAAAALAAIALLAAAAGPAAAGPAAPAASAAAGYRVTLRIPGHHPKAGRT